MKRLNKYQIFNIVMLSAYTLLFLFEIIKFCIYSSHRELSFIDYRAIGSSVIFFLLILSLFVVGFIYNKVKKCRIVYFVFFAVMILLCIGKVFSTFNNFLILFFPTDTYSPPFIDKFTSLFEFCYMSVYATFLIVLFVIFVCKKHFKKTI